MVISFILKISLAVYSISLTSSVFSIGVSVGVGWIDSTRVNSISSSGLFLTIYIPAPWP